LEDRLSNTVVPIEGGLYVTCSSKAYGILKVLKVEEEIVHVRLYKNKYEEMPTRVAHGSLQLGSIDDKDGFGIGHLPIGRETFASWQPQFLQHGLVEPEELDGYQTWKESHGGVWG
jgi:hypothetical protein